MVTVAIGIITKRVRGHCALEKFSAFSGCSLFCRESLGMYVLLWGVELYS